MKSVWVVGHTDPVFSPDQAALTRARVPQPLRAAQRRVTSPSAFGRIWRGLKRPDRLWLLVEGLAAVLLFGLFLLRGYGARAEPDGHPGVQRGGSATSWLPDSGPPRPAPVGQPQVVIP